ncbi:MAG TPA: YqgE/AlgH family protein [Gaiellaceae bacterium]|nr:YqgE/AlgH family protein [Gaiellaceae bacterium]
MDSLAGKLLISSPSLVDPNFRRTVVLVTHHDEEGAVGIVLSRPSEMRIDDAVPDLGALPYADEVVYIGGPVQPEAVVVLAELDEPLEETEPIVGSVVYMPPGIDVDALPASRVRVFAGYSGWGPGQLERELEESAWIVAAALPQDVFASDPDDLWRTVLHRKGGKFTLIATMPFDPGLN